MYNDWKDPESSPNVSSTLGSHYFMSLASTIHFCTIGLEIRQWTV